MFLRDLSRTPAQPVFAAPRGPARITLQARLRGLTAATPVETANGWRPAADLRAGDRVMTLDGGAAVIVALDRQTLPAGSPLVHLPGGVLDNCDDALILPHQALLLDMLGLGDAPYGLIDARSLCDAGQARLIRSPRSTPVITPVFAQEEAVWAHSGLLLHCLGPQDDAPFFPRIPAATLTAMLAERQRHAA